MRGDWKGSDWDNGRTGVNSISISYFVWGGLIMYYTFILVNFTEKYTES